MSGLVTYGGERTVQVLGRSLARQLGRDGVVIDWIESGVRLTSADTPRFDLYIPALVRAPEMALEEIAIVSFREVEPHRKAYWTVVPYSLNPDRELSRLDPGFSTRIRRLAAHVPAVFDLDRPLEVGGGVLVRFTPTGNAPDLDVVASAKLRRGV